MATIVTPWRRGSYCAKLSGQHDRYGLNRDFVQGHAVKSNGGTLTFEIGPGWYEVRERYGAEREYFSVSVGGELNRIADDLAGYIGHASGGPNPGEPGAWNDDRCHCGEPVDTFDAFGFPRCESHSADAPASGVVEDAPDPIPARRL